MMSESDSVPGACDQDSGRWKLTSTVGPFLTEDMVAYGRHAGLGEDLFLVG